MGNAVAMTAAAADLISPRRVSVHADRSAHIIRRGITRVALIVVFIRWLLSGAGRLRGRFGTLAERLPDVLVQSPAQAQPRHASVGVAHEVRPGADGLPGGVEHEHEVVAIE